MMTRSYFREEPHAVVTPSAHAVPIGTASHKSQALHNCCRYYEYSGASFLNNTQTEIHQQHSWALDQDISQSKINQPTDLHIHNPPQLTATEFFSLALNSFFLNQKSVWCLAEQIVVPGSWECLCKCWIVESKSRKLTRARPRLTCLTLRSVDATLYRAPVDYEPVPAPSVHAVHAVPAPVHHAAHAAPGICLNRKQF